MAVLCRLASAENIERIYAAMLAEEPAEFTAVSADAVKNVLAQWEKTGIFDTATGDFIGFFLFDHEGFLHILVLPEWRRHWQLRQTCFRFLEEHFRTHEQVATRLKPIHELSLRICRIMGFAESTLDGEAVQCVLSKRAWEQGDVRKRLVRKYESMSQSA